MIVTCQSCGANERLADRFVTGRTALVRCSMCRGLMVHEPLSIETRRYWAVIATSVCGPFTARELKMLVEHGEIHGGSYLWTWDMVGWERVVESSRLAFVAAWVRELTPPALELVHEVDDDDIEAISVDDEVSALVASRTLPLGLPLAGKGSLALHAALGFAVVTLMGGGLVASTSLLS